MATPSLCTWCRTKVFDADTLQRARPREYKHGALRRGDAGKLLMALMGVFSYYNSQETSDGRRRTWEQNTSSLLRTAKQGCPFCALLGHALGYGDARTVNEAAGSDRLVGDFTFELPLSTGLKWSHPWINREGGSFSMAGAASRFRLFGVPADSVTSVPAGETASHPDAGLSLAQEAQRLRRLMDDCADNHGSCAVVGSANAPSLLLHVADASVRLVEVSSLPGHDVGYACLSYCWGGAQPFCTTAARLSSYLGRIDEVSIPQTIMDAIKVVRCLAIAYLWVDSYCIVQDSEREKIAELAKMARIYSEALCTICPMASRTAHDGFLDVPDAVGTDTTCLYDGNGRHVAVLETRRDFSSVDVEDYPLLQRAWTLQESLLSLRTILFFHRGERPIFRCNTHMVRSDGGFVGAIQTTTSTPAGRPARDRGDGGGRLDSDSDEVALGSLGYRIDGGLFHAKWHSLVTDYMSRAMTDRRDRFPALMGIVETWSARFDVGLYRAGLWSKALALELMWSCPWRLSPRRASAAYTAPSWSWASRAHPVEYSFQSGDFVSGHETFMRVLGCAVEPVVPALPNGAVRSASLTVACVYESVNLSEDEMPFAFLFDDDPRPADVEELWLLTVGDTEPWSYMYEVGIGVVEVKGAAVAGKPVYKRVGLFDHGRRTRERSDPGRFREFTII